MILTALVIDHDGDPGTIVRALEDAGFNVIESSESKEGLKHTLNYAPRVVIMDEAMPSVDDAEMLPVLRKLTESPIIMVGSGGEVGMTQALLQGADVYLARPVNVRELIARIRALLRRYGTARGFGSEPLLTC